MAQNITSGANSWINYGFESTYGTVAGSFPRPFGYGAKVTVKQNNNMEAVFGLGARNATANVAKKYEGTATIDFLLGAGDDTIAKGGASWLRAVLGAIPTDAGATPYTHTYAESNSLVSFSVSTGNDLGTNDNVMSLIGCKVSSCKINAAVGEIAKVTLDCPFRTIAAVTTGGALAQVVPTEVPLTFAQGTLSVAGTTVGYVQSFELTIKNNLEMIWGLGSRYSTAGAEKKREYLISMSVAFSDVSLLLEKFYGKAHPIAATDLATLNPAGVACVLTFDNGLTVINQRSIVFTFANLFLDEHSLPLDVSEVVKEEVTGWALSCTSIVVKNATSTDVAAP